MIIFHDNYNECVEKHNMIMQLTSMQLNGIYCTHHEIETQGNR